MSAQQIVITSEKTGFLISSHIPYLYFLSYLYVWNCNMKKCKNFIHAVLIQLPFMLYGDTCRNDYRSWV